MQDGRRCAPRAHRKDVMRRQSGGFLDSAPLEVRQARQGCLLQQVRQRGRGGESDVALRARASRCGRRFLAGMRQSEALSQRSVPSSPNRAYRMPRCSSYSTAARIWRQRPTSFSRRFQATLEHRWRGPRRRVGPQMLRAVVLAQGQEPLSQGDRGKLAHARTSCPESWRGGPATNVADVARGQPAPPA